MTDIKDCCCCGKVYKKPKDKDFSLHSARHQSKCMMKHGVFMLFQNYEQAKAAIYNWRDKDDEGWVVKLLSTGYHAVMKGGV